MRLMQVAQGAAAVELWVELWVAGAPGALEMQQEPMTLRLPSA